MGKNTGYDDRMTYFRRDILLTKGRRCQAPAMDASIHRFDLSPIYL